MKQPTDLKIETERLVLRTPTLDDAAFVQREFPQWEIVRHLSDSAPWPYPDDGAATFLKEIFLPEMAEGKRYGFIIADKLTKVPMGLIDYMESSKTAKNQLTRGFWLGLSFQGKGYMTEAVNAANKWLFENTEIDSIFASNILSNQKSHRVKEKQGFEFLGIFDIEQGHHSEDTQEERWILTKENWQKMQGDE